MSETIAEGVTFLTPLPLPAKSMAPAKIRSSSCGIIKSTRVGFLVGVDKPGAKISPSPAYGRMLTTGGGIGGAAVGMGYCTVVARGTVVGGMRGVGWDLAEVLGGRGTEMAGRGMSVLSQRTAIVGEVRMGGKFTSGINATPQDANTGAGGPHE